MMDYNTFTRWLLHSPFHGALSKNTASLVYTGRKSGKAYETPVNYVRTGEAELLVTSQKSRSWWRNLRGGRPVGVWLCGTKVSAIAEVIEDDARVAELLAAYLKPVAKQAKYFDVALDADGNPIATDVAAAAKERVIIRVSLT
jgi:deazaflavin-dependent oxidoreductase (nitroreductase family)